MVNSTKQAGDKEDAANFGFELDQRLRGLAQGALLHVRENYTDTQRQLMQFLITTARKPGAYTLCCLFCTGAIKNEHHWILIDHTGFYQDMWKFIMMRFANKNIEIANRILMQDFLIFENEPSYEPLDWFHLHIIPLNEMPEARNRWVNLVVKQHGEDAIYLYERTDVRLFALSDDGNFGIVNCRDFYQEVKYWASVSP